MNKFLEDIAKDAELDLSAKMKDCCVSCGEPFSATNVYSEAGWNEIKLSGMCEKCFDELMAEED